MTTVLSIKKPTEGRERYGKKYTEHPFILSKTQIFVHSSCALQKKNKSFTAVCSPQDPLLCVQTAAGRCPHDALLPAVLWNQRGERQINSHSAFF